MVGAVVAAVADGTLEYTLEVVKLEPGDRKHSFLKRPRVTPVNTDTPDNTVGRHGVSQRDPVRKGDVTACLGWGMSSAVGLAGLRYMRC